MSVEKQEIIDTIVKLPINAGESIGITANPGSGKTYLLVQLANKMSSHKILYIAFNSSIVREASRKFPSNVEVYTINSLSTKWAYKHTNMMNKKRAPYNAGLLSKSLNCDYLEAVKFLKDLTSWCQSNARFDTDFAQSDLFNHYMDLLEEGKIQWDFDVILKFYQLYAPEVTLHDYDYVFVDEVQDSNEVSIDIYSNKFTGINKVFVGDPKQAIYGFRGSVNAFTKLKLTMELSLKETFRNSPEVVQQLNSFLKVYYPSKYIPSMSQEAHIKKPEEFDIQLAVITRTNLGILEAIQTFNNSQIKLLTPMSNYIKEILSLYAICGVGQLNEILPYHKYLKRFRTPKNIINYAKKKNDTDLATKARVLSNFNYHEMKNIALLATQMEKVTQCTTCIGNVFTFKGLEANKVTILSDFHNPSELQTQLQNGEIEESYYLEEINILYTALSRAAYSIKSTYLT